MVGVVSTKIFFVVIILIFATRTQSTPPYFILLLLSLVTLTLPPSHPFPSPSHYLPLPLPLPGLLPFSFYLPFSSHPFLVRGVYMSLPYSAYKSNPKGPSILFEIPSILFFVMYMTLLFVWGEVIYKLKTLTSRMATVSSLWRAYLIANAFMLRTTHVST